MESVNDDYGGPRREGRRHTVGRGDGTREYLCSTDGRVDGSVGESWYWSYFFSLFSLNEECLGESLGSSGVVI